MSAHSGWRAEACRLQLRVHGLQRAAADVMILKLQLPANHNLQYRAGQFIEIILRDGARRNYSMASTAHDLGSPPALRLHLRHLPGGKFTDHVFGSRCSAIQALPLPLGLVSDLARGV